MNINDSVLWDGIVINELFLRRLLETAIHPGKVSV